MIIGVPVESYRHERRVALVPAVVPVLTKVGMRCSCNMAPVRGQVLPILHTKSKVPALCLIGLNSSPRPMSLLEYTVLQLILMVILTYSFFGQVKL